MKMTVVEFRVFRNSIYIYSSQFWSLCSFTESCCKAGNIFILIKLDFTRVIKIIK